MVCTTMPGYAVGSRVRRQGLGTRCKAPALAHCSRVRAAVLLSALLDRTGKFPLTGLPCLVGPCLTGWVLGKYLQVLETRTRKEFTNPHHTEPRAVAQCELPAVSPHDYRKSDISFGPKFEWSERNIWGMLYNSQSPCQVPKLSGKSQGFWLTIGTSHI